MPRGNNSSRIRDVKKSRRISQPAVQSVARASKILSCLSDGINTITEIAIQSQLSKSTVHRLLKALEESNLAMQEAVNHRYYLGPLITCLISDPRNTHEYLIECSIEEMKHLSAVTGETVTMTILRAVKSVLLYEIQSKQDLRVTGKSREFEELYAGATFKVLLSQLDDDEMKTSVKYLKPVAITDHTITDKVVLMSQLKEIRRKGYDISFGERVPGALCLSTPIINYNYPVALSIVGPASRLRQSVPQLLNELQASARRISSNIAEVFQF